MGTSFHQDLNGDGVIGVVTKVIEAFGSTDLVEVGNNFYLDSNSSGSGPELKYVGAPVVAGQFGAWTPIGVEQTATGYEVAWKAAGTDQYTVWNTDSQDLNGDGTIGVVTNIVEAFGSTSMVEVGNNFSLNSNSSGLGPELKYVGTPVVAGEFGAWAPIGVEQTATGYEVAWKATGADQYTVWNAGSNGTAVSDTIGTVSGSSSALESLESSFHQDLNGDGVIGVPAATSRVSTGPVSQAALVIVASDDTFIFRPGVGADVIVNAGSADTIELDGFSSVTSNAQLASLLNDAQTGQSQTLFQTTNGGHDTVINLGNHDSITLMNVHISELHASNFIIH